MKHSPLGNKNRPLLGAFFLALALLLPTAGLADSPIRISIEKETLVSVKRLRAHFGCELHEIDAILPGLFSRPEVDIVIIAKALHLGGLQEPLEFVPVCNARRETEEVALGRTVMAGQQFDTTVLQYLGYSKAFYVSTAVTRLGEFQKGFYCLDTNKPLLDVKNAGELNAKGTGVIGLHWGNDADILNSMGIVNVRKVPTFESMIRMIGMGRADWIPLEISSSEDMSMTLYGFRLVPIPGIKFSLIDSRHFLVSRAHPDGERVFTALQGGLAELRRKGFIRAALVATGFFSDRTANWTLLNKTAVERAKTYWTLPN